MAFATQKRFMQDSQANLNKEREELTQKLQAKKEELKAFEKEFQKMALVIQQIERDLGQKADSRDAGKMGERIRLLLECEKALNEFVLSAKKILQVNYDRQQVLENVLYIIENRGESGPGMQEASEPLKDDVVLVMKNKEIMLKLKYLQGVVSELEEEKETYKALTQDLEMNNQFLQQKMAQFEEQIGDEQEKIGEFKEKFQNFEEYQKKIQQLFIKLLQGLVKRQTDPSIVEELGATLKMTQDKKNAVQTMLDAILT